MSNCHEYVDEYDLCGQQGTFLIYKEDKSALLAQSYIGVTHFCSVYFPVGYNNTFTAHNE